MTDITQKRVVALERRLARLYEEQSEMRKHPNYPWIDEIPGWKFTEEQIDYVERELGFWAE